MPPGPAPAAGVEVSSRGACARRANLAAVGRSAGRLALATTTTGAEANNLSAVPAAITSGPPVSTEIAEAGRWVRAARRAEAGGSCGAAAVQAVVAAATAANTMSTAPV